LVAAGVGQSELGQRMTNWPATRPPASLGAGGGAVFHVPTRRTGQARAHGPAALQTELQTQLDRALQDLSEEHRAVVVLTEIEGLPLHEAAEILGASVGTIKSRLHYAKKRLQILLKPYLNL